MFCNSPYGSDTASAVLNKSIPSGAKFILSAKKQFLFAKNNSGLQIVFLPHFGQKNNSCFPNCFFKYWGRQQKTIPIPISAKNSRGYVRLELFLSDF